MKDSQGSTGIRVEDSGPRIQDQSLGLVHHSALGPVSVDLTRYWLPRFAAILPCPVSQVLLQIFVQEMLASGYNASFVQFTIGQNSSGMSNWRNGAMKGCGEIRELGPQLAPSWRFVAQATLRRTAIG